MASWRDQALCAYIDPELWFPEKGCSSRPARRICQVCPVQVQCRDEAAERGEQFGIWGGLSYKQRLAGRTEPGPARQAESAREHARVLTRLPVPDAARALGVSERTVQRWRSVLQEAS